MSVEKPTRLERHRIAFISRKRRGAYLRVFDLTTDEMADLSDQVFSWFSRKRELTPGTETDPHQTYLEVLTDWGIICPHPEDMRSPGGSGVAHDAGQTSVRWLRCLMCGCTFLIEGPWVDGRVMVGQDGIPGSDQTAP